MDEFQGTEQGIPKKNTYTLFDAVPTVDVRLSILSRRLADSVEDSAEQKQIQKELAQTLNDRTVIQEHIQQIVALSSSTNDVHSFAGPTQQRMKLTRHDCYKSVTQYIDEKCFDLQVRRTSASFSRTN